MANFFIRRPIVAIVISILTVMLGAVIITGLSIEPIPVPGPANIRVTGTYPGASAEAVEQSVATHRAGGQRRRPPDLHEVVEHQRRPHAAGRHFEVGTDQDIANVLTQNRVSAAQARLPQEVTSKGSRSRSRAPAS